MAWWSTVFQNGVKALAESLSGVKVLNTPNPSESSSISSCFRSRLGNFCWWPGGRDYRKNSDPVYSFFYP